MSERPRILLDSTTLNDLFSGSDISPAQNILRDAVQGYNVNISDIVRGETTGFADNAARARGERVI